MQPPPPMPLTAAWNISPPAFLHSMEHLFALRETPHPKTILREKGENGKYWTLQSIRDMNAEFWKKRDEPRRYRVDLFSKDPWLYKMVMVVKIDPDKVNAGQFRKDAINLLKCMGDTFAWHACQKEGSSFTLMASTKPHWPDNLNGSQLFAAVIPGQMMIVVHVEVKLSRWKYAWLAKKSDEPCNSAECFMQVRIVPVSKDEIVHKCIEMHKNLPYEWIVPGKEDKSLPSIIFWTEYAAHWFLKNQVSFMNPVYKKKMFARMCTACGRPVQPPACSDEQQLADAFKQLQCLSKN